LEKAREDELVEKQFRKVENRLEADYANLRAEIKELKERQHHDKWTIGGLLARMDGMEARMAFLQAQVTAVVSTLMMDSSREEHGGEAGDQRMLESLSGMGSFSSFHLNGAQLDAFEALGRNWEFLNQGELATGGGCTPAVP